jgi:hypothetical protein
LIGLGLPRIAFDVNSVCVLTQLSLRVFQFSVKHEQKMDCGGGYIKLLPASSGAQMADFGGDTPYRYVPCL